MSKLTEWLPRILSRRQWEVLVKIKEKGKPSPNRHANVV